MDNQTAFIESISARLDDLFQSYNDNRPVPPATVFRLEGYIAAGCELALLTEQDAWQMIKRSWDKTFDQPFPACASGKISIPVNMPRAPVYPST
ncbi:MAG: hypothetical protein P8H32_05040 [Oceanicoccus sp.]|uniref:hypothetical protein n=1 Tax=Oceanicoccus sp. TaxID=2691044 RepID=UPI0026111F9F|nr:hypothetical protein [Oceanicoccus sp.]MDG1772782.1 hypothetical protein [Oceanicoccus sp.]